MKLFYYKQVHKYMFYKVIICSMFDKFKGVLYSNVLKYTVILIYF